MRDVMEPPSKIGRYDVQGTLGQGGMGRVLLARDRVLGREVAIKVLRDDLALPPEILKTLFERMKHEAMAAATLSHPHMVTLHDMGEEEPVGLYLVFEYVRGPTLREKLGEGALTPGEVAVLAKELGGALSSAHAAGVIHRDVKPENVMIGQHGTKLTDFGIARLPDSTLTMANRTTLGTPAYSAPEALAQGEFGAASDQFSLAATLHEALSGRRAFPGDDALTVAGRVALEAPTPLATGDAKDAEWIARAEPVLRRAMSKDPKGRFPSTKIFGEALAEALVRPKYAPLPGALASSELPTPILTPPFTAAPSTSLLGPAEGGGGTTASGRRVQNIIAGAGLVVLSLLIVLQRRSPEAAGAGASLRDVAAGFSQSLASAHPGGVPLQAPARTTRNADSHHRENPLLAALAAAHDGGADGGDEAANAPNEAANAGSGVAGASDAGQASSASPAASAGHEAHASDAAAKP